METSILRKQFCLQCSNYDMIGQNLQSLYIYLAQQEEDLPNQHQECYAVLESSNQQDTQTHETCYTYQYIDNNITDTTGTNICNVFQIVVTRQQMDD